jgi:hypothetical protein
MNIPNCITSLIHLFCQFLLSMYDIQVFFQARDDVTCTNTEAAIERLNVELTGMYTHPNHIAQPPHSAGLKYQGNLLFSLQDCRD